jgi:hypothetical protein
MIISGPHQSIYWSGLESTGPRCQHAVRKSNIGISPREYRLVGRFIDKLALQSEECVPALAIQHRHFDVEQTQQAVSHVFNPARLAICCLTHLDRHTCVVWLSQVRLRDPCDR